MGLFARAMHFLENPVKSGSESKGDLQKRFGETTVAWARTLQSLDARQRSARPLAVRVIQKSLAILTGTQNVERFLGEVRLIELKHRARALGNEILESSLKLNTQTFQGRRLGGSFNTDELVLSVSASAQKNVQYRASKYAVQAQQAYREFFGDRQLASRALDRAATRSCAPPPLGRVQKPGSEAQVTLQGERQKHTKAIQDMVAKDAQSHHSDLDSVVNALADVAAARTSTKRGPPESTAAEPQGQSSSSRLSYISS